MQRIVPCELAQPLGILYKFSRVRNMLNEVI